MKTDKEKKSESDRLQDRFHSSFYQFGQIGSTEAAIVILNVSSLFQTDAFLLAFDFVIFSNEISLFTSNF